MHENGHGQKEPAPGGGNLNGKHPPAVRETTIDASDPKDRGLIREAIKRWPKRWRGLSPELKDKIAGQLETACAKLNEINDPSEWIKAARCIQATAIDMEGQVQKDEHIEHENELQADGIIPASFQFNIYAASAKPAPAGNGQLQASSGS